MKIDKHMMIIVGLTMLLIGIGCTTETTKTQTQNAQNTAEMSCVDSSCGVNTAQSAKAEVQKVEIYHFHGNTQCTSCKAVGALAEETVNAYFSDELKSGKVTFAHINAELPENKELAQKYEVTSSSLWIGVYDTNGFHKEENVNVWYKINNKEEYITYLKGIVDKRLVGDYS